MIINGNVQAVAGAYSVSSSGSVRRSADVQAIQKKDEVLLSNEGQSFSSMLQKLQSMDDVRSNKVQELSAKVANGSYQVPNENIAASLLGVRF
ncbi:flagellar biosynthesis anti-sigma factor FlgM [Selenomonas ruminantium]|jgi:negative regulator of flagellin synthesis FlgM|uniref:flagellar biosynthesis anti-sigma factor FlgM n=1 Tax=Selenomonas ruminantium TaxID=971 RepID=UPI000410BCD4|nr:flagellar biosynthesis anti-sigma factor FlgM [Selenomonas ruminantium]